jgi:hypothetical protein
MATSEIEKLERRYAENPHGLTFAPLAEVHRKNGDVARALELLTAGLELHPNYIPASIVLGRCHQDLGDLPAAEAAFAHVLRLDDENVIALKSLADINERLERWGEAETWLRRLVAVDRSNDEAREQLRRLEAKEKEKDAPAKPEVRSAEPEAPAEPEAAMASAPALEVIDLGPEPTADTAEPAAPASEPEAAADPLPVDIAALDLSQAAAEMASRLEAARRVSQGAESADSPAAAREPEKPSADETVQPMAGLISAEFQPPLEAIGGIGVETSEEVVLEVSGNTEFRVEDASEDFKELADRLSAPPRQSPPPPSTEAAPKIHEPASRTRAEPVPVVAKTAAEDEEQIIGAPASRPSYLASKTKGRSVAAFFHALIAARPPAEAGFDGGSLSSLAGDDNLAVRPAVPAADPKADGAVSFDAFFGSDREGSTPLRTRAEPSKDDLDEFQSWLQNLKR